MDRTDGIIRWCPNPAYDRFLHLNLHNRSVGLFHAHGRADNQAFDYSEVATTHNLPPITTYDWSSSSPSVMAVGTKSGLVNILKIDDSSHAYAELASVKSPRDRMCHAVSFNTQGKLAVALDRVRMDECLQIWDVSRLTSLPRNTYGFPADVPPFVSPTMKVEPSVSVSSVRFFEDQPETLVAGIRGQGLRIRDLRDPAHLVAHFQTRCVKNIAMNYADPNYFASSSLDHPDLMVWDRRATSREICSHSYLDALDRDSGAAAPWGSALRLQQPIDVAHTGESTASTSTSTSSPSSSSPPSSAHVRLLRFHREHPSLIAYLSSTGQLRALRLQGAELTEVPLPSSMSQTHPPSPPHHHHHHHHHHRHHHRHPPQRATGPQLLNVARSQEMDIDYASADRKGRKIISFDWINLNSQTPRPRMVTLRANGEVNVVEQPSDTSELLYKLVSWRAPHRGFDQDHPQYRLLQFEAGQAPAMVGPLLMDQALEKITLFGPRRVDVDSLCRSVRQNPVVSLEVVGEAGEAEDKPKLPEAFHEASTVAEKLRILRAFALRTQFRGRWPNTTKNHDSRMTASRSETSATKRKSKSSYHMYTSQQLHEALLSILPLARDLPRAAQTVMDHAMLLRAKERYLLDASLSGQIVADDPWLRFAWEWIADAEASSLRSAEPAPAVAHDGAGSHSIDLSFLGVASIWLNDLGQNPYRRLAHGSTSLPTERDWEEYLALLCAQRQLPPYDGIASKRPFHRQYCESMCEWGEAATLDPYRALLYSEATAALTATPAKQTSSSTAHEYAQPPTPAAGDTTQYTMPAARALFRGKTSEAVQMLKKASARCPELLFVSLALQLFDGEKDGGAGGSGSGHPSVLPNKRLDYDETVASKTDPYLRAISSLLVTGDWMTIANQESLPMCDRVYVAVRFFSDEDLTEWFQQQIEQAQEVGNVEAITLTGLTEAFVDVMARFIDKFGDYQTATLMLSYTSPRYLDDYRCKVWRHAYRDYLQRHRAFLQRTKFEVESTKRSKHPPTGQPLLPIPSRQIGVRCVYCDTELAAATAHAADPAFTPTPSSAAPQAGGNSMPHPHPLGGPPDGGFPTNNNNNNTGSGLLPRPAQAVAVSLAAGVRKQQTPLVVNALHAGISCPRCGRHLPRCVVCLEVVGIPRSDYDPTKPKATPPFRRPGQAPPPRRGGGARGGGSEEAATTTTTNTANVSIHPAATTAAATASRGALYAGQFPSFCLRCDHVLHLDHARQWFARHVECPVPQCRCRCNFRANPELMYP